MIKTIFIITFFVFVHLIGCNCSNPTGTFIPTDSTNTAIIMFENISTINLSTDEARIKNISIESDTIVLVVEYGGGCEKHDFKLFGFKYFLKSNPPQSDIFLSHNANGDLCKALLIDSLRFYLGPLKETYQFYYGYGNKGTILLRIYEPGKKEPLLPLT